MIRNGDVLTIGGKNVKVLGELGSGGQGAVYRVVVNGEEKALKIYHSFVDKAVVDSIISLSSKKSPGEAFIWPENACLNAEGKLCYLMKLRPQGYVNMDGISSGARKGVHYTALLNACINTVKAFRILHSAGYAFLDINHGGFFVNPDTGDILIADCDNITPNGTNPGGMTGFQGYMAPELLVKMSGQGSHLPYVTPDIYTDRFSLSILIHFILTHQHPLQGPRYLCSDVSRESDANCELLNFGLDPVYIMDPVNKSNQATAELHANFLSIWKELPSYFREALIRAFSHDTLYVANPNGNYSFRQKRMDEKEWLKALFRLRSNTVVCPRCGNDVFLVGNKPSCPQCGSVIAIEYAVRVSHGDYYVPLHGKSIFAKGQLTTADIDDHISDTWLKVVNSDGRQVVKNCSQQLFHVETREGKSARMPPEGACALEDLIGGKIIIKDNDVISIRKI